MEKIIPKVKFEVLETSKILGTIWFFLNPEPGFPFNWSNQIYNKYPKLKKKLTTIENIEERKKIVSEFFLNFEIKHKELLIKKSETFQKSWDKVNDKFMEALSEVIELDWPENCEIISARVSLNPICPRDLSAKSFDVFYKFPIKSMKATAFHEITHFLYFEKWKQVFPGSNEKEFESPHLIWKLSEIVPKAILSDKRIQKVFMHEPKVYKEWKDKAIDGKPLLEIIQGIYNNKTSFEDFLKKSYAFIQTHSNEF